MLDLLKRITRSTVIYSVGQIAPKFVGLILLPFFTNAKYLSAADYGKLSMLEAASALFIALFGFGLNYALERWYYDKDYTDRRKSILFTLLTFTIVFTIIFWGLLSVFSGQISLLLTGRSDWTSLLNLLFLCSAFESILLLPTTLLRLEEKPVLFVSSNLFRFLLYLVLTLVFLVSLNKGLEGIYLARAISLTLLLLLLSFYIIRNISFKFEWNVLRDMMLFRLPLVLSTISYIIFNITDRFSLRILSNSTFEDVGVYSLGYTMVNSVKVVILSSIWLSLRPMIYKMMGDPKNKRFYSKIMKYMSFMIICLLLSLSVFGQEIIKIFAQNEIYYKSFYLIPLISLTLIFDTLKEISQAISLNIVKKTGIIAITMIIVTIVNICLNILLIPYLNIYGAALSSLISQIVFFTVIYIFSQKYYPVPYELTRILKMIITFVVLSGLVLLISDLSLALRLPIKLLILLSFPFVLYLLNYYEEIEIKTIRSLFKKFKNPVDLIKEISQS